MRANSAIYCAEIEYTGIISTRTNFGKWKKRKWEIYFDGAAKVWSSNGNELKRIVNLRNSRVVNTRDIDNIVKLELKSPLYLKCPTRGVCVWIDILTVSFSFSFFYLTFISYFY